MVKECKADNEKLRDEIEDLEFKIKDLDNMWDFKYAKLKMEYDRLKLEFNSKINNIWLFLFSHLLWLYNTF